MWGRCKTVLAKAGTLIVVSSVIACAGVRYRLEQPEVVTGSSFRIENDVPVGRQYQEIDTVILVDGRKLSAEEYLAIEPSIRPPVFEAEARGVDGCAIAIGTMSSAAGALLGGLAGVGLARAIDSDSDDSPGVFPDGSGIAAFGTFALSVVIGAVGGLVGGAYLDEPVCSQTVEARFL